MSEKGTLRTVLSGLGRIAWDYHLPAIKSDSRFELTAVADVMPERVEETKEHFGIAAGYASFEKMLEEEKPDLAVIASPTCFHAEQIFAAFKHGADVFCEKPLAGTYREAQCIVQEAQRTGRRIMVYQPHRLAPETVTLQKILHDGILGQVFMVRRVCADFRRRNDWQALLKFGGGMLNNYGAHFIDQFLYVFGGKFVSVRGELRNEVTAGDADDVVKAFLTNKRNIIFDMEINMASAWPANEWIVSGNSGSAIYDSKNRLWRTRFIAVNLLPELRMQTGLSAEGRKYPAESNLPWDEKIYPLCAAQDNLFYDYCYKHFAVGIAPFVPVSDTLEVMHAIEFCRASVFNGAEFVSGI